MKRWCIHIKWRSGISVSQWEMKVKSWDSNWMYVPVPRSWEVCPICQAERPTKENIAAAQLRAAMDAEDYD